MGHARASLLVGVLLAVSGCGPDDRSLAWTFTFGSDVLRTRAVAVEGRVIAGGCDGTEVLYVSEATMGSPPEPPPTLPPGRYGFAGRARDGNCTWFAEGCVEVELPEQEGATVTVTLSTGAEEPQCPAEECVDGVCIGADAGGLDAGDGDAGPGPDEDAGPFMDAGCGGPCGECEVCNGMTCEAAMDGAACGAGMCFGGACCTGCWDGTACQAGDAAAACGTGGATCTACTCAGGCVAGSCGGAATVRSLTAGERFACMIETGGALYCWGQNTNGQLGQGDTTLQTSPTQVGTDTDWSFVNAGEMHVCAIKTDGSLWCWGNDSDGQLGNGADGQQTSPQRIGTDSDWSLVEGHDFGDSTCGLRGDALYCWGQNDEGQLGIGVAGADSITPASVPGRWQTIAAGHYVVCGIQMDGSLWCFGRNNAGQIGDGTMIRRPSPVRVGMATDWTSVGTGDAHVCGVRAGGQLYCWGTNASGELGNGSTGGLANTPTRVGMAADWAMTEGGFESSCAIRTGGLMFCWGNNGSGQLGFGGGDRNTPTRVGTDSDWTDIDLGADFSCGLRGASLYCAGANGTGQLGQGDTSGRMVHTAVCM